MSFEAAWAATGRAEGGYSHDPNDSGGETNHGITVAVARRQGYRGPMALLPAHLARLIARREYWDTIRGDDLARLSEPVALEVFDTGINCGPGTAVRFLQRALTALNRQEKDYPDLRIDGIMGPATLRALGSYLALRQRLGATVLLRALNGLQLAYYIAIVEAHEKNETFLFGWIANRVAI